MILLLGGTAEARTLAALLEADGVQFISSLAGRVKDPRLPEGEVRIGGFGGAEGLASYIEKHHVTAVVDATHPFATRITDNATTACGTTRTSLLVLSREPWRPHPDDLWREVPDIAAAATELTNLADDTNVLLTTGRQEAHAFAALPHRFWLRAVDAPEPPLPEHCELILSRGPYTLDGERELFQEKSIDVLVTKNSGGPMTAAKLEAARERRIPVVMVRRPPLPRGVDVVHTADEAFARVRKGSGGG